jgi:glycosyltransferase involved in cell wall biosynthesis
VNAEHYSERVRVLGLMRVHNGGAALSDSLSCLDGFCDDIYVLDDRSTDGTPEVLRTHPRVTNVVSARPGLPADPWLVPESAGLHLLYRMADFCRPDWVVMIDHDQVVEAEVDLRELLATTPETTAGLMCPIESPWNDPDYPNMIPLMGTVTGTRLPFWRYLPGLQARDKPLHNLHRPSNLTEFGDLVEITGVRIIHSGWDTLAKRIARVETYRKLDPHNEHNFGRPYDLSLLFGYPLDRVPDLISDYRDRIRLSNEAG